MWRIEEQDFDDPATGPGRIVVTLKDGTILSIITSERNEFIREAKMWSPSAAVGTGWDITDAQADDGEYEIGLLTDTDFAGIRLDPEPEEWAAHAVEADGWIYAHVPGRLIEALVEERGLVDE
jgi:hypothetical protein